jgi:very-short-patch-repair endonuclease
MGMTDRSVVRVAELRNDLVTSAQLHQLGLDNDKIKRAVAAGRLTRIRRGLFTTGHLPLSSEQRGVAACLAVPDGVLSHTTAAATHGLRGIPTKWVEITVPHGRKPSVAGVRVHRSNRMPSEHVVELPNGLRITTVARTLFDLADVVDGPALRSVIEDALNRSLVTIEELEHVAATMCGRGRPGSFVFGGLVDRRPAEGPAAQSVGELTLADALTERGIEVVRQHPVVLPSGRKAHIDLAVPSLRLSIEVDHPTWHATPDALQSDHARDLGLVLLGWVQVRFTTDDVELRLASCLAAIEQLTHRRRSEANTRAA